MKKTLDARGDQCPIPIIEVKKGLKELRKGDTLYVLVDNEIAMQNLLEMADQLNIKTKNRKSNEGYSVEFFYGGETLKISDIKRNNYHNMANIDGMTTLEKRKKKQIVVVIGSDTMGTGDPELGHILMKGFIYAINSMKELPKTILFYNSGVKLSCKGSNSLRDLHELEEQGVEILSCGVSLDYYDLKEKLEIGNITNMYTIVEKQMYADLIIKP